MNNFSSNLAHYALLVFLCFNLLAKSFDEVLWNSFWRFYFIFTSCVSIPSYHILPFGDHCRRVWRYGRPYIPGTDFPYLCFPWLIVAFSKVSDDSVWWWLNMFVVDYVLWLHMGRRSDIWSAKTVFRIPSMSIVVVCDVLEKSRWGSRADESSFEWGSTAILKAMDCQKWLVDKFQVTYTVACFSRTWESLYCLNCFWSASLRL